MNDVFFAICFFDDTFIYYKLNYIFGVFYNKVYFIFYSVKLPFNCKKKIHGWSNSELPFKLTSDKRFAQSLKNTYEGVYFGKNNRNSH